MNNPIERKFDEAGERVFSAHFNFFFYHEFYFLISSGHFSLQCTCSLAYLADTDFGTSPICTSVHNRAKMIMNVKRRICGKLTAYNERSTLDFNSQTLIKHEHLLFKGLKSF